MADFNGVAGGRHSPSLVANAALDFHPGDTILQVWRAAPEGYCSWGKVSTYVVTGESSDGDERSVVR